MYNSETYIEYQFLGLATAIESYHENFIGNKNQSKKDAKKQVEQMSQKLPPEDGKRLIELTKDCYHPYPSERVSDAFNEHYVTCTLRFDFRNEEEIRTEEGWDKKTFDMKVVEYREDFSSKVAATRNNLAHGTGKVGENIVQGDKLVLLTTDLQFLIQLCILKELGFAEGDMITRFVPQDTWKRVLDVSEQERLGLNHLNC